LDHDLSRRYQIAEHVVVVGERKLRISCVKDTNRLLEEIDPTRFALDERMPYWAELWTSSLALARHCLEELELEGKSVLELGCGLGLAGIAAALAGGNVTLTDYEDDALEFARYNAARNLPRNVLDKRVSFKNMDWRSPEGIGTFDVILGADVVYERRDFTPLLNLLKTALLPGGLVVLTDPDRAIGRDFFRLAAESGFRVQAQRMEVIVESRISSVLRYKLVRGAEGEG
jgi:predicted nicotinamide N-methyase